MGCVPSFLLREEDTEDEERPLPQSHTACASLSPISSPFPNELKVCTRFTPPEFPPLPRPLSRCEMDNDIQTKIKSVRSDAPSPRAVGSRPPLRPSEQGSVFLLETRMGRRAPRPNEQVRAAGD